MFLPKLWYYVYFEIEEQLFIYIAGDNGSSWGWDIGSKESIHNGEKTNYPPTGNKYDHFECRLSDEIDQL